jgi:hypothetical protein
LFHWRWISCWRVGVFSGLNAALDEFNSLFVLIDVQLQDLDPNCGPVLPIG